METSFILGIVEKHKGRLGGLLSIMQEIQLAEGYLPEDALRSVAAATGRSLDDLYGLATFHHTFRFEPDAAGAPRCSENRTLDYVYVRCPHCNHTLMDPAYLIESLPSVRLTVSFGMEHGWIRIPSNPGIDTFSCEYALPPDGVVNFFCPHCHTELIKPEKCVVCGAPMIPRVDKRRFKLRCSGGDCIGKQGENSCIQPHA